MGFKQPTANQSDSKQDETKTSLENDLTEEYFKKSLKFILKETVQAKQLAAIADKVDRLCEYLKCRTHGGNKRKYAAINLQDTIYKQKIIRASYDYLSNPHPSLEDKKNYQNKILQATKDFEANATGIERGMSRSTLKVLVNFLLHVTGLFLITNTLNYSLTRNYLFFSDTDTHSTAATKKTIAGVMESLNQPNTTREEESDDLLEGLFSDNDDNIFHM